MQVGKRGRERSDTRTRDLSARDSIHSSTLGSICIANRLVRQEMSRTPSCTVLYNAIFNLTGQLALTLIVRAKPARCIIGNPYFFACQVLETTLTNVNTKTPGRYRSTNDSVMKSERSSLVRGSDLPKCHSALTSVGDMWRGPARRLIKKTNHRWIGWISIIGTQEGRSG